MSLNIDLSAVAPTVLPLSQNIKSIDSPKDDPSSQPVPSERKNTDHIYNQVFYPAMKSSLQKNQQFRNSRIQKHAQFLQTADLWSA